MQEIFIGWSTLIGIHLWYVAAVASIVGFKLALELSNASDCNNPTAATINTNNKSSTISSTMQRKPGMKKAIHVLATALIIAAIIGIQTNLHMLHPSWIWNPLLFLNVYWPSSISSAMNGLCVDEYIHSVFESGEHPSNQANNNLNSNYNIPLCLSEQSWKELSTDALSSKNEDDVTNVLNGIRYLKDQSGGIIFAIMARDTIQAIPPLKNNIESMLHFTNVAVVVFENDSSDGTREAFQKWAEEVKESYIVDVIECEDSPKCQFKYAHRDKSNGDFERSSSIGKMGEFRQRVVNHILNDTKYVDYSHFLVLDVDLSVSISPLGILHSLGVKPNDSIASSGRQARPGSLGSLVPPYDFSAFTPHESEDNTRMIQLNKKFCELKPEGYRWRNECTALSAAQFMMILIGDKLNGGKPYAVDSAFNGAVLYPIKLVRETDAKYDSGKDGQRCEHIGFNLSMKREMYINPKWNMNLHPRLMGGPSGERALRTVRGIVSSPPIIVISFGQNIVSLIVFCYCIITLTMLIVYPLWLWASTSLVCGSSILMKKFARNRGRSTSTLKEMEILLDTKQDFPLRKRKHSEFDKIPCEC